jgi:hypothetical protein
MRKTLVNFALAAVFVAALTVTSNAQTNSNVANVTLNAAVTESLTVALAGGTTQNWTGANALTPGNAVNASASAAVTATTTWVLQPGRTSVRLFAFFPSTTALTAATPVGSGGVNIPTSAFEVRVGAGAFTPVTQDNSASGVGVAGSSLVLQTTAITGANKNGNTNASLTFNINLSSAPMQLLPADTYTGTLSIMAQATP